RTRQRYSALSTQHSSLIIQHSSLITEHSSLSSSPMRRCRRPWIFGPRMAGVARAEFFAHFLVRAVPEAAEVARDLDRASVGREQLEGDRHLARPDARRFGEAEQLLQLDGGEDAAVVAVLETRASSARQR